MIRLPFTTAASQSFEVILSGQRCRFTFDYNNTSDRWYMKFQILETIVLQGRKLVEGPDLFETFEFGLGSLFLIPYAQGVSVPNYENLADGSYRLYFVPKAEMDAILEDIDNSILLDSEIVA